MTRRLLLLDIPPETNAGDLAREVGLIRLLRERGYENLDVTVVLGPNQWDRLGIDYPSLSSDSGLELFPALRPTFFNDAVGVRRVIGEAANAGSLLAFSILIPMLRLSPRVAKRLMPGRYRRTVEAIEAAGAVVWIGKNFRRRGSRALEAYRVYSRLAMPLAALALRRPVVCLGSSVWGLGNRPAARMLAFVLRRCTAVSMRESASLQKVRELLGETAVRVVAVPDLSLAVLRDVAPSNARSFDAGLRVSVTLVDWSEFGASVRAEYVTAMAGFVNRLIEERGADVQVVPQVTKAWETASLIVADFLDAIAIEHRASVQVIKRNLTLDELIDQYQSSDLLLASRMHSAIFALAVGTPIIAVPYDVGSKWQIIGDLGAGDFVVDYDQVHVTELVSRFDRIVADYDSIMSVVRSRFNEHIDRLGDNVKLIESALD